MKKLQGIQLEYTAISLPDILQELPELNDVPQETLQEYIHEVTNVYENRLMCKQCTKQGAEITQCGRCQVVYEDGRLRFPMSNCHKLRKYQHLQRAERLLEISRIGERFKNRRFDTFRVNVDNRRAYEKCLHYANKFKGGTGKGLLLAGDCGTGKTHLAVAILHALIEKEIPGIFVTVPELLQKLRDSYNKTAAVTSADIINLVKTAEILVLDDLGAERPNEWTEEQFYVVINARYENELPTIITTNHKNIQVLKEWIGARSFSRIIEMCDGIECCGDDYRERKLHVS
ncbi:Primosomal protein DnaI [bioreactor metagenome]|uniref:Primosomal protein DnaI n=1 Tax=bioreactor metagenome TaxID=1076179 RepID=A0A644SVJ4_9ZZZZ